MTEAKKHLIGRRTLGQRSVPIPVRDAARLGARAVMRPTGKLRRLPDFLIIGAQRSGTTSLYRYLEQHAKISGPVLGKGVHYFDTNYSHGVDWYRSHFQTRRRTDALQQNGDRALVCEASPYYLFHPLVPYRIASIVPNAKLIAILRDPIDRALSHYQHELARGFETESFESALDLEDSRLAGEVDHMRADPTYVGYAHQHYSYVARGMYADQLRRYLSVFDRSQIQVILYRDLSERPAEVVADVLEFLGITSGLDIDYPTYNSREYPSMDSSIRARLEATFAEPNERLGALLDLDNPWP